MAVRIRCKICGSLATIQSSDEVTKEVKKLYCTCQNWQCGHTFVMDLTFSHTISPSVQIFPEKTQEKIKETNTLEQMEMFM